MRAGRRVNSPNAGPVGGEEAALPPRKVSKRRALTVTIQIDGGSPITVAHKPGIKVKSTGDSLLFESTHIPSVITSAATLGTTTRLKIKGVNCASIEDLCLLANKSQPGPLSWLKTEVGDRQVAVQTGKSRSSIVPGVYSLNADELVIKFLSKGFEAAVQDYLETKGDHILSVAKSEFNVPLSQIKAENPEAAEQFSESDFIVRSRKRPNTFLKIDENKVLNPAVLASCIAFRVLKKWIDGYDFFKNVEDYLKSTQRSGWSTQKHFVFLSGANAQAKKVHFVEMGEVKINFDCTDMQDFCDKFADSCMRIREGAQINHQQFAACGLVVIPESFISDPINSTMLIKAIESSIRGELNELDAVYDDLPRAGLRMLDGGPEFEGFGEIWVPEQ